MPPRKALPARRPPPSLLSQGKRKPRGPYPQRAWLEPRNQQRRLARERQEASGANFAVGAKQIFLPNFLIQLRFNPHLPPTHAEFQVPLYFSKLDLKDILWHAYNVRTHNIRSQVVQQPIASVPEGNPRDVPGKQQIYRPQALKRMIVRLDKPFVWPEEPDWEQEAKEGRMDKQLADNEREAMGGGSIRQARLRMSTQERETKMAALQDRAAEMVTYDIRPRIARARKAREDERLRVQKEQEEKEKREARRKEEESTPDVLDVQGRSGDDAQGKPEGRTADDIVKESLYKAGQAKTSEEAEKDTSIPRSSARATKDERPQKSPGFEPQRRYADTKRTEGGYTAGRSAQVATSSAQQSEHERRVEARRAWLAENGLAPSPRSTGKTASKTRQRAVSV